METTKDTLQRELSDTEKQIAELKQDVQQLLSELSKLALHAERLCQAIKDEA